MLNPVKFACKQCGKPFFIGASYLTAYRKKLTHDPLYCSISCSVIGRKADTQARKIFTCMHCGKPNPMKRYAAKGRTKYYTQQKFCDQACKVAWQTTEAARRFKRGEYSRHIKRHGYVWISVPSMITGKKHAVMEHRFVMSQALGRDLFPEETVHHIDGNRQNNAIENLELFSSRHGPGQRVIDKIAWAFDLIEQYPQFAGRERTKRRKAGKPSVPDNQLALFPTE